VMRIIFNLLEVTLLLLLFCAEQSGDRLLFHNLFLGLCIARMEILVVKIF